MCTQPCAITTQPNPNPDVAYEISRLGHHVLEGAKHERIGESVGASALAERDRREAMEREASSGSGVGGGAAGAGAGGGSGAMGTPSAPPAANQWAGTAFGTAPAATGTDDGSSWAGAFGGAASMSNEAAARALFAQQVRVCCDARAPAQRLTLAWVIPPRVCPLYRMTCTMGRAAQWHKQTRRLHPGRACCTRHEQLSRHSLWLPHRQSQLQLGKRTMAPQLQC